MAVKLNESVVEAASPVIVSLQDLQAGNVEFSLLEDAFGPESLGIIVVNGLPSEFVTLRHKLLSYASLLANLPQAELEKLESPESKWLVGWSCGKETLKDGRYDTLKGSFYANPVQNPQLSDLAVKKYPNLPEYTAPNVWPAADVLPGFESTFQELCNLIVETAGLVARAIDSYAQKNVPDYQQGYLERIVKTSVSTKARLLHYFPAPETSPSSSSVDADAATGPSSGGAQDDWCATHLDHGCLTGLTSAMFVDENQVEQQQQESSSSLLLPELAQSPDPNAGLYIHSRSGKVAKVNIPRGCLAFQTGEALERITKGAFRAVPHFVKGAAASASSAEGKASARISRNTLAVFTQPNLWEMVDEKRDFATFAKEIVEGNH